MALGAFHLLISDFSTGKKKTDDLLSDGAARGPGPQHRTARRDQVANHPEIAALTAAAVTARRSVQKQFRSTTKDLLNDTLPRCLYPNSI